VIEDRYTTTEHDAGRFEDIFGDAEVYDDRPTRSEVLAAEHDYSWESDGGW
jgi:hypothetical protein